MVTFNILNEMDKVRKFTSLINRARQGAGFNSLKYPITDVKVNTYFIPELRELIADECNIVGYMDIPPVEDVFDYGEPVAHYYVVEDGENKVWLSTVKSSWQESMYQERMAKREEAELRKKLDVWQK